MAMKALGQSNRKAGFVGRAATLAAALVVMPLMAAEPASAQAAQSQGYVLGPNDNITVIVYGQSEFNVQTRVKPDGSIVMPLIGVGMTIILWVNLHMDALVGGLIWTAIGFVYLVVLTKGFKKKAASFDEDQPVTGFNKIPEDSAQ